MPRPRRAAFRPGQPETAHSGRPRSQPSATVEGPAPQPMSKARPNRLAMCRYSPTTCLMRRCRGGDHAHNRRPDGDYRRCALTAARIPPWYSPHPSVGPTVCSALCPSCTPPNAPCSAAGAAPPLSRDGTPLLQTSAVPLVRCSMLFGRPSPQEWCRMARSTVLGTSITTK
jgi:hypothetical protein